MVVYNDALTYDAKSGTGGVKAHYKFNKFARLPQNKLYQGLIQELIYKKDYEEDIVLDKLSHADYFVAASFVAIRDAEGPNILNQITYGRKDATKLSDIGNIQNVPTPNNFRATLKAKGFEDSEIVALASVEAFGKVHDPLKSDGTIYSKLDNFYFKSLLTKSDLPL